MYHRKTHKPLSAARLAACRESMRKAHEANRRHFVFTPARRAALDAARLKRKFLMTPAKWASIHKAVEANRRDFRMTRARRAAMRANIRKAWGKRGRGYTLSPAARAKALEGLKKAWAAPRSKASYRRSRYNHLKHGLLTQHLEETLALLGEDPKEFQAHQRLVARVFPPATPTEQRIVRRLGEAIWRRLRLHKAQARWEAEAFGELMESAPDAAQLEPAQIRSRGLALLHLFMRQERAFTRGMKLLRAIELQLRALLRQRTGGDPGFKVFTRLSPGERQDWLVLSAEEEVEEAPDPVATALDEFLRGDRSPRPRLRKALTQPDPA